MKFTLALTFYFTGAACSIAAEKDDIPTRLKLAEELLKNDNLPQARAICNQILHSNGKVARAYWIRGEAFYDDKDYDKALTDCRTAIAIDPNLGEAYVTKAKCLFLLETVQGASKSTLDETISDLNKAIKLDANNADAHECLGIANASAKNYDKGLSEISQAIKLKPNTRNYRVYRATMYEAINQDSKAIEDFSYLIKLDPKDKAAYERRAAAYEHMKQYDKALADLNKQAEVVPPKDAYRFHGQRGRLLHELGKYSEATLEYSKIIKLNPLDDDAFMHRANEYLAMGKTKEALTDSTEAIELSPDLSSPYELRARVYEKMGNVELAKKDKQQAQKLKNRPAELKF